MKDVTKQRLFSRTSIGRNRWFWVVLEDWLSDPVASGIARSTQDALAEAERQHGPVVQRNATLAKSLWAKQRAMKRQRSVANGDDAQPLEFVYRCYWDYSEYDSSTYEVIEPHRIVKKTRKRLFVEDEAYERRRPSTGEWWEYERQTFVLDRDEFETTGKAERSSKGWWGHNTYYADPALFHAERGRSVRPACFEAMDLPVDATIAQIKSAYRRLSRAAHPDAGGKDDDFVRLRQNYEEASRIAAVKA